MWWWISKRNFPATNCLNLVFGWWNLMSFPLVELSHVHRWWLLSQDILDFAAPAFLRNVNLILTFDYVASLPNGLVQPRMLKAFGWVLITFFFYETLVTFIWKLTILEKEKKWTTVSWESQQELKFPVAKETESKHENCSMFYLLHDGTFDICCKLFI